MKRLLSSALLALSVSAPLSVWAEQGSGKDPLTGGDAVAGEAKAAACVACHGQKGNSANPEWPKLAGQSPKYVVEQLKQFQPKGTRKNPLMVPMAVNLSEQDMKDLGAYFYAQKPAPGVASKDAVAVAEKLYRAGDAARGIPACAACHGPKGAGNAAAGYPRLSGQHATYGAGSLNRLRAAVAEPLPDGNLKIMATIAAKLSDQEIAALASYVNGLQ